MTISMENEKEVRLWKHNININNNINLKWGYAVARLGSTDLSFENPTPMETRLIHHPIILYYARSNYTFIYITDFYSLFTIN